MKLNQHSKKLWYTLYLFSMSQDNATQVNRHSIDSPLMDKWMKHLKMSTTYTTHLPHYPPVSAITNSYYTSGKFWQTFATHYPPSKTVSTHTMDYIDAATTGTLSPHILPIEELNKMLSHIEETLPSASWFHLKIHCISTSTFIYMF